MRRARSGLLHSFSWILASRVVAAGMQAVLLGLAARQAGPANFGLLAALLGVATVAVTLLDLGLSTYIIRERSRDPASAEVTIALRLSRVMGAAMLVLGLSAFIAAAVLISDAYWTLAPLALWAVAERQADVLTSIQLADGNPRYGALNLVGRRALALVVFVVLASASVDPVANFVLSTTVASVVSLALIWTLARPEIPRSRRGHTLSIVAKSRHFWLNSSMSQARNLDSTLVAAVAGATTGGIYSVASRLTTPLRMLPTAMATALMPAATRAFTKNGSIGAVIRPTLATLGATCLLSALGVALCPWLIPTALGQAYTASVLPTQIVIAALPLAASVSLLNSLLQGADQSRIVGWISVGAAVITLAFCAWGASLAGATGAALGTASGFLMQCLALLVAIVPVLRAPYGRNGH